MIDVQRVADRSGRLRPTFACFEGTSGRSLDAGEKVIVSERPACSQRRPHFAPVRAAVCGEQVAIERIVGVVEEDKRATIAALAQMVRMIGDDDTGEAGHAVR